MGVNVGARRIRFLESTHQTTPFEAYLRDAGWDLNALTASKTPVEFEDTRNLGLVAPPRSAELTGDACPGTVIHRSGAGARDRLAGR